MFGEKEREGKEIEAKEKQRNIHVIHLLKKPLPVNKETFIAWAITEGSFDNIMEKVFNYNFVADLDKPFKWIFLYRPSIKAENKIL